MGEVHDPDTNIQEHIAETNEEAAEVSTELASSGESELLSTEGAIMEQMRTHAARRVQRMALVSSKRVKEEMAGELNDEVAKELASTGMSELLSMAATHAAMEHIRTNNVRVNLRKLQPKVEGQEVALVGSKRDERLAGASTIPSIWAPSWSR